MHYWPSSKGCERYADSLKPISRPHKEKVLGGRHNAKVGITVGVDSLLNARSAGQSGEELADVARLHAVPVEGAEHDGHSSQAAPAPLVEPALEQREGLGVHADGPMPVALAVADGEGPGFGVDVAPFQGEGLGDAQPGAVEDGEQGPVADAGGGPAAGRAEQARDLVGGEHLRRERVAGMGRRLPGAVSGQGGG